MTPRSLRRIWFVGLWFLVPWPLIVIADAFVPAARYAMLAATAALVAVAEGGAGPVGMILALLTGMALATTLACWILAWIIGRTLSVLPPHVQLVLTWGLLVVAATLALLLAPYETPFGRAIRGGLLQVLS